MEPRKRLRLGVTGHRVLAEGDEIEAGIETALRGIEQAWPRAAFTALSALAEGADRLVAERVLARPGATLVAVLPLPEAEYVEDFGSAASRAQFRELLRRAERRVELAAAGSRTRAYERAGDYILGRCDVLIAVWDGRPVQGRGGTGAVVAGARERRKPLAWVHAGNRAPGTEEPTSLGDEQGMVTFENLGGAELESPA
jgi:hypothetical protein